VLKLGIGTKLSFSIPSINETNGVHTNDSSEPEESLGVITEMAAEGLNLKDVKRAIPNCDHGIRAG
jgi:hypothetical protein